MSSTDAHARSDAGEPVRVAPREIVDLVTRVLRIHGVDPATAAAIATDVMMCSAVGHGAVDAVLSAIDEGTIASIGAPHRPVHPPDDALADAFRSGIEIRADRLDALERAASGFLVSEATLDAIADEPTVD